MINALDGAHSGGHGAFMRPNPHHPAVFNRHHGQSAVGVFDNIAEHPQVGVRQREESQDRTSGARDEVRLRFMGADALPW